MASKLGANMEMEFVLFCLRGGGRPRGRWDPFSPTRIRPVPPALEAWSLNHWTAREVPGVTVYLPSMFSERSSGSGWGSGDE